MESRNTDISTIAKKLESKKDYISIFGLQVGEDNMQAGYNLPKDEDQLPWSFIRGTIDGSKKLVHSKDVKELTCLTKFSSVTCEQIWKEIRNDMSLAVYFPTASSKHPGKTWILSVFLI